MSKKLFKSLGKAALNLASKEAGEKLVKAPPKALSQLSPRARKEVARQLGYNPSN